MRSWVISDGAVRDVAGAAELVRAEPVPSEEDSKATAAHLQSSVLFNLGHAAAHAEKLGLDDVQGDPQRVAFHRKHLAKHLASAQDGAVRIDEHLQTHDSSAKDYAAEVKRLAKLIAAGSS